MIPLTPAELLVVSLALGLGIRAGWTFCDFVVEALGAAIAHVRSKDAEPLAVVDPLRRSA